MRGGEVDAINPTFGINLLPLKSTPGITYNQVPGLFQEHIDIQFGKQGQPLLRAPWMRQALMMGINRTSIIKTVYGELAGNTTPLDNIVYYQSDAAYKPDFHKWNFNPTKALALLKKHCTGGPSTVGGSGYVDVRRLPREVPLHVDGVERDAHHAGGHHQGPAEGHRHRDRRCVAAGERRVRPDGHPVVELRPRQLRVGHVARSRRLRADVGLRWRVELHAVLQPGGNSHARGVEQRARPRPSVRRCSRRPTRSSPTTSRPSRCTRGPTRSSGSPASSA